MYGFKSGQWVIKHGEYHQLNNDDMAYMDAKNQYKFAPISITTKILLRCGMRPKTRSDGNIDYTSWTIDDYHFQIKETWFIRYLH